MKKRMIITASILIFLFLTARLIIQRVQNGRDEKQWYIDQLHFEFSGEIDSLTIYRKNLGLILFHLTRGTIDQSYENKLNRRLHHNGSIRFLVFNENNKIEMISKTPTLYLRGDSVCINTNENQIIIYRKGKEISRDKILNSLRGRPF